MNKLTAAAIVSLAGLGLSAPQLWAWGCGHCCTQKYKVVCTQYNAFSPWCCQPVAKHGLFHHCCKPDMVMNCPQMCSSPCGTTCCGDSGCGTQAATPSATMDTSLQRLPVGAPNPQAMLHPAMIQLLQNPMMQPPMQAMGYPMPPMQAMGYPMPPMMGGAPMMPSMPYPAMPGAYPQGGYPVGYYPSPNQALIAPPGTIGLPPMGYPQMMQPQ